MEVTLRVDNNTTYIIGRLDSYIYQALKKHLSYKPENAVFMMRQVEKKNAEEAAMGKDISWKQDWDGSISTVCWSAANCKCAIRKQGTHFPTGLASRAIKFLNNLGVNVKVEDIRRVVNKSLDLEMSEEFETREYQGEVINSSCNVDRGIIKICTGGGKCISKDSLCLTEDGLMDFNEMLKKDIEVGEYISFEKKISTPLTKTFKDISSHIYYDGLNSKSFNLETSYGFDIVGTPNHKIKILSEDGLKWKALKDIKIGDYAAISYSQKMFGQDSTLSLDDAYWLGLLSGDSCLRCKNVVKITTADDHIENFVMKYAKSKELKVKKYYDKRTLNTRDLNIHSIRYREKLYNMGVRYDYSYDKEIPLIVRKSNQNIISSFIRGLYEIDGYVTIEKNKPTINIALSSRKMIKQLHLLFLNFGILSYMRRKVTKRRDSFILTIYRNSILPFMEYIGFDKNGYKIKQVNKAIKNITDLSNDNFKVCPNQNKNIRIVKKALQRLYGYRNLSNIIKYSGLKKNTLDSWVRNDSYQRKPSMKNLKILADWLLGLSKYNFTTTEMIESEDMKKIIDVANQFNFIADNFVFDEIVKKEMTLSDNYDFVVPDTNSFVSQGFVNHNTSIAAAIMANRSVSPMIFYVTSIDLLSQAKKELTKFIKTNGMNISVGEVSGLKKDIKDITVMTVQTAVRSLGGVWKKFDDEDNTKKEKEDISNIKKDVRELIKNSKLMMCDEVQHWAAETCQIISDHSVNARYRYGLSATPFRDQGDDILIDSCFGKVISDISASKLINLGFLVKPKITFIPIDNSSRSKKISYANIYKECIVDNASRNNIISVLAQNMANDGRSVLILCQQIAHGKILEKLIPDSKFLHGVHSAKKRKEHLDLMRSGEASITIASTIFDEGVDCKPLDGLILAGGGKSPTRALQRVGRVLRPYTYPNGRVKLEAMVVDFMDECAYLRDHSKKRLKIYRTEPEFEVEIM